MSYSTLHLPARTRVTLLSVLLLAVAAPAQRTPAVETSTMLDCVRVTHTGPTADKAGKLIFHSPHGVEMQAAFLPGPDRWDPMDLKRSGGHRMWAKLTLNGVEKAKFAFIKYPVAGVFSRFRTRAMSSVLSDAGFQNVGDEFDGKKTTRVEGPWNNWPVARASDRTSAHVCTLDVRRIS